MLSAKALTLLGTVLSLLLLALGIALFDRWTHRRRLFSELLKVRTRQADCPWPVDDERPAHVWNSPQHNARDCQ